MKFLMAQHCQCFCLHGIQIFYKRALVIYMGQHWNGVDEHTHCVLFPRIFAIENGRTKVKIFRIIFNPAEIAGKGSEEQDKRRRIMRLSVGAELGSQVSIDLKG